MKGEAVFRGQRVCYGPVYLDHLEEAASKNIGITQEAYNEKCVITGNIVGWSGKSPGVFFVQWEGDLTISLVHSDNIEPATEGEDVE
jgi:hypothetical protein